FNHIKSSVMYTLSLHDALPISGAVAAQDGVGRGQFHQLAEQFLFQGQLLGYALDDKPGRSPVRILERGYDAGVAAVLGAIQMGQTGVYARDDVGMPGSVRLDDGRPALGAQ